MNSLTRGVRLSIILAIGALAATAIALNGPIAQPSGYHEFADQRRIWGIPNFWNVVSSLPFFFAGLAGLVKLVRQWPQGALVSLKAAYLAFFAGAVLVAIASAYYHYAPADQSLALDRLPMTIIFMAFLAIIIGEHISSRHGRLLFGPLLVLGVISVAYWYFTEAAGRGDLRPYIIVQFVPMILIPLILLLFPSRFSQVGLIWAVLGTYGLAKLLELVDERVFSVTKMLSGHTLKHLLAALGVYVFFLALTRRRPAESGRA